MKKVLIILTVVLLLTACSKQEKVQEDQSILAIDINELEELGLKPALELNLNDAESKQSDSTTEK